MPFLQAKRADLMRLSGILLLIVCVAKLIAVSSKSELLAAREDLSGISYGKLTAFMAILEAFVGTSAAFFPKTRFAAYGVAWLGILFAGYKGLRGMLGFRGPCHCLGSLFAWWPWGAAHETLFAWLVTVILLFSSAVWIFFDSASRHEKK